MPVTTMAIMPLSKKDQDRIAHLDRITALASEIAEARARAKALTDEQSAAMVLARDSGATWAQLKRAAGVTSPTSLAKRFKQMEQR